MVKNILPKLISSISLVLMVTACSSISEKTPGQQIPEQKRVDRSLRHKIVYQNPIVTAVEDQWGIRIIGLRSTMRGMMIDFRYKIMDAKKAAPLLDLKSESYLVVEKNGAKLGVPNSVKIGALRQTTHAKKVKEGRDYFILFGNPGGKYAQPGDKVAVVIGDFRAEHLTLK